MSILFPLSIRPPLPQPELVPSPDEMLHRVDPPPPIPPAEDNNGLFHDKHDKEAFVKSLYYFTDAKAKKSSNKTLQKIAILIKIAKKLNIKYLHEEEITTGTVIRAISEITRKNQIAYELGKIHPGITLALKTSELVDIFRPLIQTPLENALEEARQFLQHPPSHLDVIDQHCQAINNTLIATGAVLGISALEVASSPDRFVSAYVAAECDATLATGHAVFWGVRAVGAGVDALGHGARTVRLALTDAIREAPPFTGEPYAIDPSFARKIWSDSQQETPSATKQPEEPPASSLIPNTCATLKTPVFPNPYKPHPITEILGGSVSVSGGSGTRPTFSGQLTITLAQPHSPSVPPQIQNALHTTNVGGGQKTSGSLHTIHREDQDKAVYTPLAAKQKTLTDALADYNTKRDALQSALDSVATGSNDVIAKTQALAEATRKAMTAAYEVHKFTCTHARRHYWKDVKVNDQRLVDINTEVKNLLWNEFKVPRKSELKRDHLSRSGTLKDLSGIESAWTTNDAEFTQRDACYVKIVHDCKRFFDTYASLLPKFIANEDKEKNAQDLLNMLWQEDVLEKQIRELIGQCPTQAERNAELLLLLEEITTKSGDLSFCTLPPVDKSCEIAGLRAQLKSPSSSAHHEKVASQCQTRYSVLLHQLQASGDHATFSACFNEFLDFLHKEDALTDPSVAMIASMGHFLLKGVEQQKVDPDEAIRHLIALQEQSAFKPATAQNGFERVDLDPLHITIGALMSSSEDSTSATSRQWYEKCRRIQPDQPQWTRAIAACHLHTLHWSLAEQSLLEAFAKEPNNENTKHLVSSLVMDKYSSASLLLEWLQTVTADTSVGTTQTLSRLKSFANTVLKTVNVSTTLLLHPLLLKKWLPPALHLPTEFRPQLTTLLNEDGTDFTAYNITTLASRLLTTGAFLLPPSKEAQKATFGAQVLQQLLTAGSGGLTLGSTALTLGRKYMANRLQRSDLLSAASQSALALPHQLSVVIPILQALVYKDNREKRLSQQAHPYLHTAVETLASRDLAATLTTTDLLRRSTPLLSRGLERYTGIRSTRFSMLMRTLTIAYFIMGATRTVAQTYRDIVRPVRSSEPPAEPTPGTHVAGYLTSLWGRVSAYWGRRS